MSVAKSMARVAPLLLAFSALAQNQFCMGGNLDQISTAQKQVCQQQLRQLRTLASSHNSPDWHYVVVCDEQGWKDYAAFSKTSPDLLQNAAFDTDLEQHTTFVHGSRLVGAMDQAFAVELTKIERQTRAQVALAR